MTGKTLGASLEDVMNRVNLYRPGQLVANQSDMIAYLTRRGYLDFRECPDHALAALHLAEKFQIEALWVNAFAHCVGMNLGLHTSVEFNVSNFITFLFPRETPLTSSRPSVVRQRPLSLALV